MQDYRLGLRVGLKDLPTSGACACITENGKMGGGVGTGTHLRVYTVEQCSQELLVRHFLRDGKSENLNQQRTLGEMHRAMEHSRGHLSPLSKVYS